MMQIFEGLPLNLPEAEVLSIYLKAAKGMPGVIHTNGYLTTAQGTWERPMARERYEELRRALERTPEAEGIVLGSDTISFDPRCVQYDLEAIKDFIATNHFGVKDSPGGLLIYRRRETYHTGVWYEKILWALQGVTVAMVPIQKSEVVSLSQSNNPDDADWEELHFVA